MVIQNILQLWIIVREWTRSHESKVVTSLKIMQAINMESIFTFWVGEEEKDMQIVEISLYLSYTYFEICYHPIKA